MGSAISSATFVAAVPWQPQHGERIPIDPWQNNSLPDRRDLNTQFIPTAMKSLNCNGDVRVPIVVKIFVGLESRHRHGWNKNSHKWSFRKGPWREGINDEWPARKAVSHTGHRKNEKSSLANVEFLRTLWRLLLHEEVRNDFAVTHDHHRPSHICVIFFVRIDSQIIEEGCGNLIRGIPAS